MTKYVRDFQLEPDDKDRIAYLVGPEDENLKQIDKRLGVKISYSGAHFHIEGKESDVKKAEALVKTLYVDTAPIKGAKTPSEVTPDMVHLAIVQKVHVEQDEHDYQEDESKGSIDGLYHKANNFKTKRGFVKARTSNQSTYISNIVSHDISFGIGPAGTGKTYLAVAAAVDALERNEIRRIILTRPAVEAGEKLGYLPGDLSQKVDPYLRPLYDALFEMLGFEKVEKLIERQIIEIAPLAYMRGRTLNDSFIILDEAQNTTIEQMKMFLTRIGFNSKAVITGDPSQIDLPKHVKSGLKHAVTVLKDVEQLGFTFFESNDVVRHPVVAAIVNAYDAYDRAMELKKLEEKKRALEEVSGENNI
ncbi:MAG: PhoH family protein [Succinivibrio sp.]|jgi:phosphate starvation-inducible PhoH-like protein|nr:PhoH family protein [Succinivibrio sp.]